MTNKPSVQAHPELWKGLDEPSDSDREWFHANPTQIIYIRELFPEELEAHDAMSAVAFGGGWERIQLHFNGEPIPITHVAVINILRLAGIAAGPEGQGCRLRIPCSTPLNISCEKAIKEHAYKLLTYMIPNFRAKRHKRPRGFA